MDCWMEIQHGKGPWAPPVSGIVPLGSTLTLVVAINDYRGKKFPEFDKKVNIWFLHEHQSNILPIYFKAICSLLNIWDLW